MITANTLVEENALTSAQWASSNPVLPNRVLGYDITVRKYKMGNGSSNWVSLQWWSDETVSAYVLTIDTTKSAPYTLTSPELAQVNAFGKYPNFVALIGGQVYADIQPIYTGAPGSFTQVQILLHNDGSGGNLDTTIVQFS